MAAGEDAGAAEQDGGQASAGGAAQSVSLTLHVCPQILGNCNYAVELGRKLNFSLVGIAGSDIKVGLD